MLEYIRYQSTNNILEILTKEENQRTFFPSLENDPHLRNKITLAFEYTKNLLKSNRADVTYSSNYINNDIVFIRKNIDQIINKKLSKINKHTDSATMQRTYSKVISDVYNKYKNNDAEAFCGETSYLFFNKLCDEGVDKELMRVLCFKKNYTFKDSMNANHGLILYSSCKSLFKNIEQYCGFGNENININSYKNFIDLLIETKNKKEQLLILDPWSKDNKIIDLMYEDNDVYQLIIEKEQNLDKKIIEILNIVEKKYISIIINDMLNESGTSSNLSYKNGFLIPEDYDFNLSVHVHQPFILPKSQLSKTIWSITLP